MRFVSLGVARGGTFPSQAALKMYLHSYGTNTERLLNWSDKWCSPKLHDSPVAEVYIDLVLGKQQQSHANGTTGLNLFYFLVLWESYKFNNKEDLFFLKLTQHSAKLKAITSIIQGFCLFKRKDVIILKMSFTIFFTFFPQGELTLDTQLIFPFVTLILWMMTMFCLVTRLE